MSILNSHPVYPDLNSPFVWPMAPPQSHTRWVCQTNLVNQDDALALRQAILSCHQNYQPVEAIPFSDTLNPPITPTPLDIYVGCTTLCRQLPDSTPGFFYSPLRFRYDTYRSYWNSHMLNANACIIPWVELMRFLSGQVFVMARKPPPPGPQTPFFIRPVDDLKPFTGGIMTRDEILTWAASLDRSARAGDEASAAILASDIVLAEPQPIINEYRCILVNGECISVSTYRVGGRTFRHTIDRSNQDPKLVCIYDYAEARAKEFSPAPVFVLDLADVYVQHTPTSVPVLENRIIEAGCFNWCGFYACDLETIVRKVSEYVLHVNASASTSNLQAVSEG